MMKKVKTTLEKDGFNGCFFEICPGAEKCMIVVLSENGDDYLHRIIAKYLSGLQINTFALAKIQNKEHRNYMSHWEIDKIQMACDWLKARGISKIGIHGTSTGGNLALTSASLIPDIYFVWAMTRNDYVLEGQEEGRKEGMRQWCTGEGIYTWKGRELPYHPYYLTAHELSDIFRSATKKNGELTMKPVMEHAEQHPVREEAFIKIEKIRGHIFIAATQDDTMWNTQIYLPRMEKRLKEKGFSYPYEIYMYDYGTHFFYPERLYSECAPRILAWYIPRMFQSGKRHMKEIKQNRLDLQEKLQKSLTCW